jgi:hypothetical protein
VTGRRLEKRVEALEVGKGGGRRPYVFLVQVGDETLDDARARYEAKHGPLGDSPVLVWNVVTGVPRCKSNASSGA